MAKKQKIIFGIDEVGRGPLAGPIMAVAIMVWQFSIFNGSPILTTLRASTELSRMSLPKGFQFSNNFQFLNFQNRDSKKLSAKQREEIYNFLKKNPQVKWGTGRVEEWMIDKINILQATKLAMQKAVLNLEKKISQQAALLLIDGNFGIDIAREQRSIIKGDEKIFLISLASIVAKVERDRLMLKMHQKYPQYGFNKHKGYGTKLHFERLKKFGSCKIHRQTFEPIKSILGKK